jgi:2,4-dienoyl-CoA reductase-like NADH-dependent reductase (Old Yellow Enzyme family)
MSDLFAPLTLPSSVMMKNRFMLAPMTNCQSHEDGRLSEEEFRWLVMRARGGFAVTMTGAASVQASGKGFAGQLGIYSDGHIEGLSRLAAAIRAESSIALIQLHHSGIRSVSALTGTDPVGPSAHAKSGARALTESEIEQVIADFITAAERAERAAFDGVEIHGAHGYLLGSFLSPVMNQRSDVYGGSLDNRARILRAIIAGIRERCRPGFVLGLRLSPEGQGVKIGEVRVLAGELLAESALDFLDMSLWQVMKEPEEETFKDRRLIGWFADIPRGRTRFGVAGHIRTPREAQQAIDLGADFVLVGHAAIIHHDFPVRLRQDGGFAPVSLPVTRHYLNREGVSDKFVAYIKSLWPNFVAEESAHS